MNIIIHKKMFDFNLEFTELYYEFGKKIILGV